MIEMENPNLVLFDWRRRHGNQIINYYQKRLRSTRWLSGWLAKKYSVIIGHGAIYDFLKKEGLIRPHAVSMKARVISGTIDYGAIRNKTDYKRRKMNYQQQWIRRKQGISVLRVRKKIINLSGLDYDSLRSYSKQNKMTLGDAYLALNPTADPTLSYSFRKY